MINAKKLQSFLDSSHGGHLDHLKLLYPLPKDAPHGFDWPSGFREDIMDYNNDNDNFKYD